MEATSSTQDSERMKFTGQERDLMGTYSTQTDDLDDMHARFYNPNIARFLSPDPLRGDPHAPQSFNLFAYVSGNPMNYVDPSGLEIQGSLSYFSGKLNQTDPSQTGWGTGIAGFFAGLFTGPDVGFKYWGIYGVDPYAWQHNNWAFGSNTPGGSSSGGIGGGGAGGYPGSGAAGCESCVFGSGWWSNFKSGTYWGTGYGQAALDSYAATVADPGSSWLQTGTAYAGGFLSATWTPNTYLQTYSTLMVGATGLRLVNSLQAGAVKGQEGLRLAGRFIAEVNQSKHGGNIALRLFLGKSYYLPHSAWLANWLFRTLW